MKFLEHSAYELMKLGKLAVEEIKKDYASAFGEDLDIRFKATFKASAVKGTANIDIDFDKTRELTVDIGRLALIPTLNNFTLSLISLNHEKHHFYQMMECCTPDARQGILLDYISKQHNYHYYRDNYFSSACEIDAEKEGLLQAYDMLVNDYGVPEDKAFKSIKSYIEQQNKKTVSLYNEKFCNAGSINEIEKLFDGKYKEALEGNRDFSKLMKEYEYRKFNNIPLPTNTIFYNLINEDIPEDKFYEFLSYMSGEEQIKMVASYVLEKHPSLRESFSHPIVSALNFSDYTEGYKAVINSNIYQHPNGTTNYFNRLNALKAIFQSKITKPISMQQPQQKPQQKKQSVDYTRP